MEISAKRGQKKKKQVSPASNENSPSIRRKSRVQKTRELKKKEARKTGKKNWPDFCLMCVWWGKFCN